MEVLLSAELLLIIKLKVHVSYWAQASNHQKFKTAYKCLGEAVEIGLLGYFKMWHYLGAALALCIVQNMFDILSQSSFEPPLTGSINAL